MRPHLNKNKQALCNPLVPITTNLFGDNLNKQADDLTKANKIQRESQDTIRIAVGHVRAADADKIMLAVVV